MTTKRSAWFLRLGGMRSVLVALALVAATPLAGWAQAKPEKEEPLLMANNDRAPARLVVQNNNWLDVHLYMVRDGISTSLGVIDGPGQQEFNLPGLATTPGFSVQILALPIGGRDSYLSPAAMINPGDQVDLVLQNNLALSSQVVSPAR